MTYAAPRAHSDLICSPEGTETASRLPLGGTMKMQTFGALLGSAILVSLALACERGDSLAAPAASSATAACKNGV